MSPILTINQGAKNSITAVNPEVKTAVNDSILSFETSGSSLSTPKTKLAPTVHFTPISAYPKKIPIRSGIIAPVTFRKA